eukprot:scaffold219411_cov18-Tisochrysis_lutea.AAC.1
MSTAAAAAPYYTSTAATGLHTPSQALTLLCALSCLYYCVLQLKQAHEDGCNAEGEAPKAAATSELVPAPVQAVSTGSKRVASTGRGRKGAKRARGGRRGVPADEADAEEELEEEQGGDKERVIEGGGTGGDAVSAGLLSARADALAQKLMFVFDAAQKKDHVMKYPLNDSIGQCGEGHVNVPIIRVIVNRAMTDLLLLFGHNTWKVGSVVPAQAVKHMEN